MRLRVVRLIIVACAALALCGCECGNGIKANGLNRDMDGRFEYEDMAATTDAEFGKVVDTDTGVTYLVMRRGTGECRWGGMTPLLNRDGTPVVDGRFE